MFQIAIWLVVFLITTFELVYASTLLYKKTRPVTDTQLKQYQHDLELLNFSSISNLPRIIIDQDRPSNIVGCFTTPIPATIQSDCKQLCGDQGKLVYIDSEQGFTDAGVQLSPGYYCVSTLQTDLENCNRLYGVFVVGSNGYICENLYKTGMAGINANLPLYKFVNNRYIESIVLRSVETDEVIDPLQTYVDFNDPNILTQVYVDASEATIDGYKISCKNFVCFQDPCSSIPFTQFQYDVETGKCICTGGQNSDPQDDSSTCIGTGVSEDSYDASKQVISLTTNCATGSTLEPPFSNIYPCNNQSIPLDSGVSKIFLVPNYDYDFNTTIGAVNLPPNSWNKNVNVPTILFEQTE